MSIVIGHIFLSIFEIITFAVGIRMLVRASIVKRTIIDRTSGFMVAQGPGLRYVDESQWRAERFSWGKSGWHGIYHIDFIPVCLVIIYLALLGEILYWIWFM